MAAMASMASNSNSRIALAGFLLASLTPIHAWSGDWKFTPSVSLNERYSDNIGLSSTNPEASFTTEIRPGFLLSSKGGRGQFSVDYGLQGLIYSHDSAANTVNNQLSATLKSDWLDDRFFIDADARITQQNTNTTGPTGTGNYNLTNNRSETRSASFAPSWKSRFGNRANLEARWQITFADSDNAALSGATGNNLSLGLSSGSEFNRIPWNLDYRMQTSDGTTNGNRNSSISGGLGYIVSPKTRLNLTVGSDSNNGTTSSFNQASGMYWNLGVNWAPTNRTSLSATAGKRYNGSSYGLNFAHRTRKTTWALRYSEVVSDPYALASSTAVVDEYLCNNGIERVAAGASAPTSANCGGTPPRLLNSGLTLYLPQAVNGFNLNKTWSGTATYKTGKSLFSIILDKSRRELLATNDSDDIYSLAGSWNFRFGPRLSSTLSMTSAHADTATSQSDDWSLAGSLVYQLSRQATGLLELRRVERDSGSTSGAYKENSVSARLNMSF